MDKASERIRDKVERQIPQDVGYLELFSTVIKVERTVSKGGQYQASVECEG